MDLIFGQKGYFRGRGKRGLDCLRQMQEAPELEVLINDDLVAGKDEVDAKLIDLAQKLDFENLINYNCWFLTEDQRDKFNELFLDFKTNLMKYIKKTNNEDNEKVKPYLIFQSLIPFKKINEQDTEKKSYKKFFKALD